MNFKITETIHRITTITSYHQAIIGDINKVYDLEFIKSYANHKDINMASCRKSDVIKSKIFGFFIQQSNWPNKMELCAEYHSTIYDKKTDKNIDIKEILSIALIELTNEDCFPEMLVHENLHESIIKIVTNTKSILLDSNYTELINNKSFDRVEFKQLNNTNHTPPWPHFTMIYDGGSRVLWC